MNVLVNVILAIQMLTALGMIGLILIQHGKGADMGAAFGSGGSGSLFGASGSANFLSRTTSVLAAVFFVATLALAYALAEPAAVAGLLLRSVFLARPADMQPFMPLVDTFLAAAGDADERSAIARAWWQLETRRATGTMAPPPEGDALAVLGAAGGVGLTAVEIGAALGARVIAVARGAARLGTARAAGATETIDSETCLDLRAALRALGGVDVVYDPVGDALGEAAFGALRPGGRFLLIGFAGGKPPRLPLNHALVKNIAIHGLYWGAYRTLDPGAMRDSLTALMALYQAGRLHPHVGATLPLERLPEAYALLESRSTSGKIVVTI